MSDPTFLDHLLLWMTEHSVFLLVIATFEATTSAFTCFCRSPPTTEKSREVQERNNPIDSASERAGDVRATAGDAVAK